MIKWVDGGPVLSDRGSANGTFVGGKPVIDHPLREGDEITIGPFVGTYRYKDPKVAEIPPTIMGATIVEGGDLIRGQIADGALPELLQGIEFNKKTGTLFVFSAAGQGWVTFAKGAPRAAESGVWKDADALFFLLGLDEGRFSFTKELSTDEHRMKTSVTALLLEWGRRVDEGAP